MPELVPLLTGPPGRSLELQPLRYEFPVADNDWDANWLVVRITVADEQRRWSSTDPAFLTWDLRRLVRWLHAVAAGEPELVAYSALEPNLQLEASDAGMHPKIQVHFGQEFTPPTGAPSVLFAPDAAALHHFANALEGAMAAFPIRVVESDGPAQWYLRQLEKGASRWTAEP
jgi:hypothetical protein